MLDLAVALFVVVFPIYICTVFGVMWDGVLPDMKWREPLVWVSSIVSAVVFLGGCVAVLFATRPAP